MNWINKIVRTNTKKNENEKEDKPRPKIAYRATLEPTPHPRYNIDKKEVERIKKLMNF